MTKVRGCILYDNSRKVGNFYKVMQSFSICFDISTDFEFFSFNLNLFSGICASIY